MKFSEQFTGVIMIPKQEGKDDREGFYSKVSSIRTCVNNYTLYMTSVGGEVRTYCICHLGGEGGTYILYMTSGRREGLTYCAL